MDERCATELGGFLGEGVGNERGHDPAATLLGCAEHFGDRCFDTLVGIGDDQFHVAQTAAGKAAQEVAPEDLGFGMARTWRQPSLLTPTAMMMPIEPMRSSRPGLYVRRVHPEVGPVAFGRAIEKGFQNVRRAQ